MARKPAGPPRSPLKGGKVVSLTEQEEQVVRLEGMADPLKLMAGFQKMALEGWVPIRADVTFRRQHVISLPR